MYEEGVGLHLERFNRGRRVIHCVRSSWASTACSGSCRTRCRPRTCGNSRASVWWWTRFPGCTRRTCCLQWSGGEVVPLYPFALLHCSCYGCALDLATGRPTDAYVRYMLRKVALLKTCGIQSVQLVFDGQRLPLKVRCTKPVWSGLEAQCLCGGS